ncbi:MAG TPA: hypothetical protein VGB26_04790 [Nitrospiria bacterium]|jgi:hypothetical protein
MKKRESEKEDWKTPSLDWIHRVRRERQSERAGRPPRPLSQEESEKLSKKYGLKLVRKTQVDR